MVMVKQMMVYSLPTRSGADSWSRGPSKMKQIGKCFFLFFPTKYQTPCKAILVNNIYIIAEFSSYTLSDDTHAYFIEVCFFMNFLIEKDE